MKRIILINFKNLDGLSNEIPPLHSSKNKQKLITFNLQAQIFI